MTYIVENTAFNKNLTDRLNKLESDILKLSPENFEKISPALIKLARKSEPVNFLYDDMSMINSIDAYKISSLITYLKRSYKDFIVSVDENVVPFTTDEDGGADDTLSTRDAKFRSKVPEGFSGMRSFVLPFGLYANNITYRAIDADGNGNIILWYTKNEIEIVHEWKNIDVGSRDDELYWRGRGNNRIVTLYWR